MSTIHHVQDWLDQTMTQSLTIWCENPEIQEKQSTTGNSGRSLLMPSNLLLKKSFVTYRIKYKQPGRDYITIRHRYSEFETLRSVLRDLYHPLGIFIPPLPPKQSLNNHAMSHLLGMNDLEESFVKERLLGLTLFCENLVKIPWLRHDNHWKAFLHPQLHQHNHNSSSGSSGNNMQADGSGGESKNVGYHQLLACLQQMELPYKSTMGARIESVREELAVLERHARVLLEKAVTLQKCERALQSAQEAFSRELENYSEVEKSTIKGLAGRTFNNDGHSVLQVQELTATSVKAASDFFNAKCEANQSMNYYTGVTLVMILEQEIAHLETLKDLLKQHDDLLGSIATLQNKIKNTSNPDSLHDLREIMQEKDSALSMFYSGFIYFTLPLMARQRAVNMRRLTGGYVAAQTAQSYRLYHACEDFFRSMSMTSTRLIEETNIMLSKLQIRPISTVPPFVREGSEGSDDEHEEDIVRGGGGSSGSGSSAVDIIPHMSIRSIRSPGEADATIQHIDNLTGQQNHHPVHYSVEMNRLPRGGNLSDGSTGLAGLYARALLHDRGLSSVNHRSGVASAGESNIQATKTLDRSEGRTNPLAVRRGSAVLKQKSAGFTTTTPSMVAGESTSQKSQEGVEVEKWDEKASTPTGIRGGSARLGNVGEYVSLRAVDQQGVSSPPAPATPPPPPPPVPQEPPHQPAATSATSPAKPIAINPELLDSLLDGKGRGGGLASKAGVWEDI